MSENKTAAERSKARRIRAKGDSATPEQKKWLEDYDATVSLSAPPPRAAVSEPQQEVTFDDAELDDRDERSLGAGAGPLAGTGDDGPEPEAMPEPMAATSAVPFDTHGPGTCPIPNCPACAKARGERGGQVCPATGETVYPPISDTTAAILAMLGFFLIGAIVSMKTRVTQLPAPDTSEVKDLAAVLKRVTYQHFNSLGEHDDAVALCGILGRYGARAMRDAKAKVANGTA